MEAKGAGGGCGLLKAPADSFCRSTKVMPQPSRYSTDVFVLLSAAGGRQVAGLLQEPRSDGQQLGGHCE